MIKVRWADNVHPAAKQPFALGSVHSAAFDLRANISAPIVLTPGARVYVDSGFSIELEADTYAAVCSRSGLALKDGVAVLNAPGIIDADYRGPVGVVLYNTDFDLPFEIDPGDRIAQMVIMKYERPYVEYVDKISDTARGGGGFGSSGK